MTLRAKPSFAANICANSRRVITVGFTSRRSAACAGAKARTRSAKEAWPSTIRSTSLPARSVPLAMLPYTNASSTLLPSGSSA